MFEVDIKINGCLIGHIYGHNKGSLTKNGDSYYYQYYEIKTGSVFTGNVTHKRDEGIEPLIQKIFNELPSQKGVENE